ncbi:AraC family transcriptional regulator [Fibrella sp. ES10-3-2-2]|nr:hypothetical protein A6C57_02775 [Fibrella sp. ES10-3-2-2]
MSNSKPINVVEFPLQPLTHPASFHNEAIRIFKATINENGSYAEMSNNFISGSCEVIALDKDNWAYIVNVTYKEAIKYVFEKKYKKDWLHVMLSQPDSGTFFSHIEYLKSGGSESEAGSIPEYGQYEGRFLYQPAGCVKFISLFISQKWLSEKTLDIDFSTTQPATLLNQLAINNLDINNIYNNHNIGNVLDEIKDQSDKALICKTNKLNKLINDLIATLFPTNYFDLSIKKQREMKGIMEAERLLVSNFRIPPPTLDELAKVSGLNRVKFQQLFKKTYGLNFYQHYQLARFTHAKQLIEKENYNISEAAYTVGFKNLSYFSIKFFDILGVKPAELKKKSAA